MLVQFFLFSGKCYVDKLNKAIEKIMDLIEKVENLTAKYDLCIAQIQDEIIGYVGGSDYSVFFDRYSDCIYLTKCRIAWLLTSLKDKKEMLIKEVKYETDSGGYFHSRGKLL